MRIEIFPRLTWRGRRWFFRVRAKNGEIIAQSEAYHNRVDCRDTANSMRAGMVKAEIFGALG